MIQGDSSASEQESVYSQSEDEEEPSSASESDFADSAASDDEDVSADDASGDDWEALEEKAAKCELILFDNHTRIGSDSRIQRIRRS